MRWILGAVLALGLAGCAAENGAPIDSTPSASEGLGLPSNGPSLVAGATIVGVLSADSVEGGCVFLAAEDGDRYEVLWPDGWRVSPQLELFNDEGEMVADSADRITIRGRIASDMGSICQIGQVFQAIDVTVTE